MKQVEFHIPDRCDFRASEALIEQVCIAGGLTIAIKGSLASLPGSTHWHFKKSGEKGTLEITVYPREHRIWAQVQAGRRASWIEVELPRLQMAIEKELCAQRAASTTGRSKHR